VYLFTGHKSASLPSFVALAVRNGLDVAMPIGALIAAMIPLHLI